MMSHITMRATQAPPLKYRTMQQAPDAGAYAGLALGLQVVLASLLLPLAFRVF
jgi:putative effector of murein hydrolase